MNITTTFATIICALAFLISTHAQTEIKCDADDKDCLTTEKAAVNAEAKFKAVKFVPDANSAAPKTMIRVDPTPTPTPKPADEPAAAAKPPSNGSNPAELITRVEIKYQFQSFAGGYLHAVPIIRADYAITPTVSIRADLPVMVFDPKLPTGKTESGIGDVVLSMTFVKPVSKKLVLAFVPLFSLPAASHSSMGSGKYSFKPLFAMVTPIGKWGGFVQVLEYRVSFAGDKTRTDINELSIKPIILKSFTKGSMKGFYINPKAEVIVDFENNNKATMQAGFEFGKALNKNVVVFVTPTAHVAGTKRESFKLEVGFRYLFR
ncbi:MAG TPA: hypothetical protein PLL77_13935 [Pyrinomonadaceae bacterium]|nr:hypothetical protein [Pyrinomonadaceae bacterium]